MTHYDVVLNFIAMLCIFCTIYQLLMEACLLVQVHPLMLHQWVCTFFILK